MRTHKMGIALLGAVVMVFAVSVPVSAKGRAPQPPSDLVDVTMRLVGAEGLTTDCQENGTFTMRRDQAGLVGADDDSKLGLFVNEVKWERRYPVPESGVGFGECHGESVDGSPSAYGGIGVTIDSSGAVTGLRWHFDYYVDVVVNPRNGRKTLKVLEHFTLSGQDLDWDATTSTLSGWFGVAHHLEDRVNGDQIGYVPFEGSPRYLSFTFEMVPHPQG